MQKHKTFWLYLIPLFIVSRLCLLGIGYISQGQFLLYGIKKKPQWEYSEYKPLNFFGVYDTGWYLEIAKNGYPVYDEKENKPIYAAYSFFPLYPMMIRILHVLTGIDYYPSALIISNVCLIIAAFFLYRLTTEKYNEETGLSAVKFLFLFPVAFILSGAFSESLYLALILSAFYYAHKQRWLLTGIAGFFLALSRPIGVLAFIPLILGYFLQKGSLKISASLLFLLLIPAGLFCFSIENYIVTNDFFRFANNLQGVWGKEMQNPFTLLYRQGLLADYPTFKILGSFTVVWFALLVFYFRKISLTDIIVLAYSSLIPMSFALMSMPRMLLVAFPFFVILGKAEQESPRAGQIITISLALLQGLFAAFWVMGNGLII